MATRHRSNMSISRQAIQRPDSRASTTSAVSHHESQHDAKSSHALFMSPGPEAALLQYQASMNPNMPAQYMQQQQPQQQINQQLPQSAHFPVQAAYSGHESPHLPDTLPYTRVGSVPVQNGHNLEEDKRRRGSAVTATNDRELREMLARNEGRALKEVAAEVNQKERTPMAEKTKQLFAMLWLRAVCKPAKTSVPRNRVYSQYANRCATERVTPLNPASFGKLVRVIFPGIQTRRLGVRGESKYHYVDLAIEEESLNQLTQLTASWNGNSFGQLDDRPRRSESVGTQQLDFSNMPRLQADTAAFPPADGSFDAHASAAPAPRGPASKGRAFAWPDTRGMQQGSGEALSYQHTLRFPSINLPGFSENEPVNLPSIQPYLPPRTDNDAAEALIALYRTHCTSLIDSIRFCKEKQFFRLYTSFHGTLTVPVQKLFMHPNLAPWIEQCDLVMYRTMVRFVSRLTLQAAPVVVINILSNISANLHGHIAKTFAAQPQHVLEAKLRPAAVFASLLYRLIRVNQSAHAAANLLTIDQNREQMWFEWVTKVNPKRVMEAELPNCGYEEVYQILTSEMRSLLEPLQAPEFEADPYSFQAYNFEENGSFASYLQTQMTRPNSGPSNVSTETILDRWSAFISSLPSRFPKAETRTLLHCISAIGTATLRDITIANGQSYGHWWVLKLFVDEMSLWLAEMGGFLEPETPISPVQNSASFYQSPVMENGGSQTHSGSHNVSRMSSMAPDNSMSMNGQAHGQHFQPSLHRGNSFETRSRPQTSATTDMGASFLTDISPPNGSQQFFTSTAQSHQNPFANAPTLQPPTSHHHQQMQHMQQQQQQHENDMDDSGIGMSLMDDDLTLSKYGLTGPHIGGQGMGVQDVRVDVL